RLPSSWKRSEGYCRPARLAAGRSVALTQSKRDAIAIWKFPGIGDPRATAGMWSRARKPSEAGARLPFLLRLLLVLLHRRAFRHSGPPWVMIAAKASIRALFPSRPIANTI